MSEDKLGRRDLFKVAGAGLVTSTLPTVAKAEAPSQSPAAAQPMEGHGHHAPTNPGAKPSAPALRETGYVFLRPREAAFVDAAGDIFIPKDEIGPGAVESGTTVFIDRQLATAFGQNAKRYATGPFLAGTPSQGYQLPLTPAEIIRIGIQEVDGHCRASFGGRTFPDLSADERNALLTALNESKVALPTVPSRLFVTTLLSLTIEGYFADPIYGGNRDKGAWRMIGFPGVISMYSEDIDKYRDRRYVAEPQGIADLA